MGDTAADLEIWMEAVTEAAKISESGMKMTAREAEFKADAAKATDSVSSAGTSSAATAASTAACAFTRNPTSTSSIVGVAIRSGCTLIIIMLKVFDTRIRYIRVSAKRQARAEAMRVERKR